MEWFQDYIKIEEAAKLWNVTPRRVQALCAAGKIEGAARFGRDWMIPQNAAKPVDGRTKAGRLVQTVQAPMAMPRKTPFLHMTDLYHSPGHADACVDLLEGNPEAQALLRAQIAYSRGQIDKAYESAHYLLYKHSGFYAMLSAGMMMALCAIWRGDLNMWRQAKIHMAEAPAKNDTDRDIIAFSITAIDSVLYNVSDFPEWFKIGRFELLHKDALPAAKVFYAKYLYAAAYAVATKQHTLDGMQGLSLMAMLPAAIEPMISQAMADNSVVTEIYLRMTCAVTYYTSGNSEQAIYHIDRAIALALPDKLYGLLAEYCRTVGALLEQRLKEIDESVWAEVKSLYRVYNEGWSRLSGSVRGKHIATTLTPREREVAKLAAFGMKNSEIASSLYMSVSAVKQAINNVSNKTGMPREEFAAIL